MSAQLRSHQAHRHRKHELELARESLEEALTIFHRLGAKKEIERTKQALGEFAPA